MALNKAWRDKAGSGTQYEADSSDPSDNTPVDAAGMRDLESRAAAAITAAVATEATARTTNDTALNAAFAAGLAGRAPLSSNAGDTGKAIDAHTGAPLPLPTAESGSGHVIQDESVDLTARAKLNFTGAGVTVTDNSGTGATDVSISGAGVSDASTTVKGVTKLSTAPASASNPIAVGDNDPRLADTRTPTDNTVSTAKLQNNAVTAAKVAADVATQAELDAVAAAAQPLDADLTSIAALSTTTFGRALLTLADAAAGRTTLALGTAATQATGAFDAAGAAAAAQAASQPLDSDLTSIAALTTTSFGRGLLALADAAAGRTTLALGNVDNTSDVNKPVSTAQATADALKIPLTQRAAVNGVATLDGSGLIPVNQLPASTAAVTRSTTGAPLVLVTDQVGDFAFDAVAGVLYGPLTGSPTVGLGWNAGSATAAINRIAPNASQTYDLITGWIAESVDLELAQNISLALTSGTLALGRVFLPKGATVTGLGFSTSTTAAITPTHSWMGLYDSSRAQLATTGDLTTAAIPNFSTITRTIAQTAAGAATQFVTTYSGWYFVGLLVTAGTMPNLYGLPSNPPMNQAPGRGGTGNTGLTGPPGFPASAGTLTFIGKELPYFGVVGTL